MKYNIIYADPPWSYNDTQKSGGTAFFGASVRYELMKNSDIYKLPINEIADKDCVLFLWATSPLLPEALETIKSWGFKFKTIAFCWNKQTKNGKWVSNMGRWTMGKIEICLLGVKGHPKKICKNIKQLVIAERKEHSKKPEEVRKRIVDLMGNLPRVELFARQKTEGWDVFGNNIDGKDIADVLNNKKE
jgi:site-specific DNA-methyltransferase (adenine-specific)